MSAEGWKKLQEGIRDLLAADAVAVPDRGEFFVRDGKVIPVLESELMEPGTEDWAWRIWTKPEDDE